MSKQFMYTYDHSAPILLSCFDAEVGTSHLDRKRVREGPVHGQHGDTLYGVDLQSNAHAMQRLNGDDAWCKVIDVKPDDVVEDDDVPFNATPYNVSLRRP